MNITTPCLLCKGKSEDEDCNAYRECLRRGRETLSDNSVNLIKNIQIASGLVPDTSSIPGLLEEERRSEDRAGCLDGEKI
jgi:hypothetical protein